VPPLFLGFNPVRRGEWPSGLRGRDAAGKRNAKCLLGMAAIQPESLFLTRWMRPNPQNCLLRIRVVWALGELGRLRGAAISDAGDMPAGVTQ